MRRLHSARQSLWKPRDPKLIWKDFIYILSSYSWAPAWKRVQTMSSQISLGSPVFQRGYGEIMTLFPLLGELFFKAGNSVCLSLWSHTNHEQLNISQKSVWDLNKMKLLWIKVRFVCLYVPLASGCVLNQMGHFVVTNFLIWSWLFLP